MEETTKALNEMNGQWIFSKPIYVKLSRDINHTQTPNLPIPSISSPNVTYPPMVPMAYLNIPRMLYVPAVMLPPPSNNFPLPIAPPNSRVQSTTTQTKRPFYPYTPVYTDDQ